MSVEDLDIVALAERIHRKFLEAIQIELDRHQIHDINSVRAMILLNLKRPEMTVSELMGSGCYLGSNVSYNLKKLTDCGYLEQFRSPHDRRAIIVRSTTKSAELCALLQDSTIRNLAELFHSFSAAEERETCRQVLRGVEQSCTRLIEGRGRNDAPAFVPRPVNAVGRSQVATTRSGSEVAFFRLGAFPARAAMAV